MAEENSGKNKKFKEKGKVKRVQGSPALGIVTSIRADSGGGASERGERGIMVGVQWDNGTFSYFTPDALELA